MKTITRYILTSSLAAILTITAFGMYSLYRFQANEVRKQGEKLESCIRTFWELLYAKGTDFRIVDGALLAGSYRVNGNCELPDKVQEIFGGVATIFMGDERVATNVLDAEGKRAMGTRLVEDAHNAVFREGKPFRGKARILGVSYLTAYDPIRDQTGNIIGVLFVGVKESEFQARLNVLKMNLALTLLGLVIIFSIVMVCLAKGMKRVESANRQQLRFQQTLIDTIPSPLFYKDTELRYLGCNKAFAAYVGLPCHELVGKKPHDLWPKELADRYVQQDLALLACPGTQTYEATVRYADGTLHDVIFNKATFTGTDGAVAGLVGVILDITGRKAAEDATRNAYQQLFDIVEFLPDATFVVDKEGLVVAWNRALEELTGIKKQDILGKGDYAYSIPFYRDNRPMLIDLLDKEQERAFLNYITIKQEGQTIFTETFVPSFRGGDSRYFSATATPLFDSEGNPAGAIESIRDITDYKKALEERVRLLSQLQHGRMLESLMSRLSHDLRTPLTPLFILYPLIRERVVDPELRMMLDLCHAGANSMKKLVDRAQLLVSLSLAISEEDLEPTPLVSGVERALADCVDSIAQKHIVCRNDIDPSILVSVVPDQLKELFANLISNAIRFSPDHGVIRVAAEQAKGRVTASVHDDGIGLDPDHLERIFDEFFKADESRHDLSAAGLGLSISKRIVLNHRGRIWAESPGIGGGTTIKFTIDDHTASADIT